jgi:hypothetical protein
VGAVLELAELVGLIEQGPDLNVVVFDSANPDFYLAHYDAEHDPARTAALPAGRAHQVLRRRGDAARRQRASAGLGRLLRAARRPAVQARCARLEALGWGVDSDLERPLGRRVVESIPDA